MMSMKLNNTTVNKSTLKSLIFIFILLFIILSLSFAQVEDSLQKPNLETEKRLWNQDVSKKEIGYQQQEEVGDYFGLDSNQATLQSLTQKENINIERVNNQITVKGKGDFKLVIKDKDRERIYENFQYNEEENTLVFDENNELTEGTKFKTKEDKQGQTYDIKGYEITIHENDAINIKKDFTEISIAKGNKIIKPKKIRESAEEPIFKFKATEGAVLEDGTANIQGTLNFQGENYFYLLNENLNIDGIKVGAGSIIENQNERTNIYFDSATENSLSPPNYEGAWIRLNKDKGIIVTGTNNEKKGPVLDITASNPYIKYSEADGIKRNLVIQALGDSKGSRIELIDKSAQDELAQMNIFGPGLANLDNKGIRNDVGKGDLFLRVNGVAIEGLPDATGTSTVPMKIKFFDSEGNPLSQQGLDFYANAHLQFASIPKDFQWEKEGIFKTNKGFSIYPRLKYNYLPLEYQEVISTLTSEQRQALENEGFFEMSSGKQKELLEKYSRIQLEPEQEDTPYEDIEPRKISEGQINDYSDSSLYSSSVRIKTADGEIGSGTVIGIIEENGQKKAVILTAGHVIERTGVGNSVSIDFFGTGKTMNGNVVDFNYETDTGLVKVPISGNIPFAKVAPQGYNIKFDQDVATAGCDLGADCSIRRTRTRRGTYIGPIFETEDTPIEGRSGGGVFDNNGKVIGVTSSRIGGGISYGGNYEPPGGGVYADLKSIQDILRKNNLSFLFKFILIYLRINNSFILFMQSTLIIY